MAYTKDAMIHTINAAIEKKRYGEVFDLLHHPASAEIIKAMCKTSGIKTKVFYEEIDRISEAIDATSPAIRKSAERDLKKICTELIEGETLSKPLSNFERKLQSFKKTASRTVIATTLIGSTAALATMPEFDGQHFADTFKADAMSTDNMVAACVENADITTTNGKFATAWAVANYPTNGNERARYDLVMQSVKEGLDPILIAATVNAETGNLRDIDAKTRENKENSATSLLQYTIPTRVETIMHYGDDNIDYSGYPDAEQYIKSFMELNAKTTIDSLYGHEIPAGMDLADKAFSSPKILAQFNAKRVKDYTAEFSAILQPTLERLNTNGLESSIDATRTNYIMHFKGISGGRRMINAIAQAPNTKITDNATLNEFGLSSSDLRDAVNANKGLFRHIPGALQYNITIVQFADAVYDRINGWTKKEIARTQTALDKGDSIAEICAIDPDKVRNAVPEKTTLANAAFVATFTPQQRSTIEAAWNTTAAGTLYAYNGAVSGAQKIYAYFNDSADGLKPETNTAMPESQLAPAYSVRPQARPVTAQIATGIPIPKPNPRRLQEQAASDPTADLIHSLN